MYYCATVPAVWLGDFLYLNNWISVSNLHFSIYHLLNQSRDICWVLPVTAETRWPNGERVGLRIKLSEFKPRSGDLEKTCFSHSASHNPGGGVGGGGTWVKFYLVCAAGTSELPPHYSLFLVYLWPNIDPILVTFGYYSMFWASLWPVINPILVTFWQIIFLISKSQKRSTPFCLKRRPHCSQKSS